MDNRPNWGQLSQLQDGLLMMARRDSVITSMVGVVSLHQEGISFILISSRNSRPYQIPPATVLLPFSCSRRYWFPFGIWLHRGFPMFMIESIRAVRLSLDASWTGL